MHASTVLAFRTAMRSPIAAKHAMAKMPVLVATMLHSVETFTTAVVCVAVLIGVMACPTPHECTTSAVCAEEQTPASIVPVCRLDPYGLISAMPAEVLMHAWIV